MNSRYPKFAYESMHSREITNILGTNTKHNGYNLRNDFLIRKRET